jgi:hypothetical protein
MAEKPTVSSDTPLKETQKKRHDKSKKNLKDAGRSLTQPSYPTAGLPSLPASFEKTLLVQSAMKQTLSGGVFIDTKLYAYSKRKSGGIVGDPLPVYSNSSVLRASSSYFEGLLGGGFREDDIEYLDAGFPQNRMSSTEEYDYFSDSDLEDDEEESEIKEQKNDVAPPPLTIETAELSTKSQRQAKSVTDDSFITNMAEAPSIGMALVSDLSGVSPPGRRGRVIVIREVAYKTLRALIYYLYTDKVAFAPLRSQGTKSSNTSAQSTLDEYHSPPPCSPKSMYRVADRFGLDDLKKKAEQDIRSKLTSENILTELYSTFTSSYDKISQMEISFACDKSRAKVISSGITEWTKQVASGELVHSADVLSSLVKKLVEVATAPPPPAPPTPAPRKGRLAPEKCPGCTSNTTSYSCYNCGNYYTFTVL